MRDAPRDWAVKASCEEKTAISSGTGIFRVVWREVIGGECDVAEMTDER